MSLRRLSGHLATLLGVLWLLLAVPAGAENNNGTPTQPVSLGEACRRAWKENANLKVSRLQEKVADQEVVRARSGFLPKVNTRLDQTIYDDPVKYKVAIGPGGTFSLLDRNYWESQSTIEQTIFDLSVPARYRKAVLGREAAKLDTYATRDDIFLLTAQLYFQTLRAQKLVTTAEQEVVQLKDHRRIAQDLYDFGVVTYNDVLQAQVALADAQQRLISARNSVVNTRSSLNKVIGVEVTHTTRLVEETGITAPPGSQGEATEAALRSRNDLKAAARRVEQGEKGITEAQAGYLPRLYAQGGHYYQQNDKSLHDHQYFAIFGLQWNLFNGLDTKAQVSQAREKLEQLKVQSQDLSQQVQLDVQNAYLALKETAERIGVTKEAVVQGEENLRLNEERYKEQVGTATDVIDAQTLLTRTRVNYYNALYDHQFAKAQMLRAVGKINDLAESADSPAPPPSRHGRRPPTP